MAVSNNSSSSPLSEINTPVYEVWGITQSKLYTVNFTWTIKNFSCLKQFDANESPTFSAGVGNNIKWCLRLIPRAKFDSCVSLFIHTIRPPNDNSLLQYKYKISILNGRNEKVFSKKTHNIIDDRSTGEYEGFEEFIGRTDLLKEENNLLPNDTLTIVCEIDVVSDKTSFSGLTSVGQLKVPDCNLSDDFAHLLDSQKLSDVKLVIGEQEYPAHKVILGARSDVFAAMFEHEMEENKSGQVIITDVKPEVLQEMLHFIYTGESPKLEEMTNELLIAADKYAVQKLKMMCERALSARLSPETAAETLMLADRYNGQFLKKETINFFHFHGKDIIKTSSWKEMVTNHPVFLAEMFEALFTQK